MGSGHQNHAGAECDQLLRRRELKANRSRADPSGEKGRAKGLNERIVPELRQPAPQPSTHGGAQADQQEALQMSRPENHAECRGTNAGHRGKP